MHLTEGGEGFDFLGFHHRWVRPGRHAHIQFLARWSSRRATQQARGRIRALTGLSRLVESPGRIAQDVKRFLRGWAGYFRYGNAARQFTRITVYAAMRVLLWWAKMERLRRRPRRHRFVLAGHLGLLRLDRWVVAPRPHRPWRVRANAVRCTTSVSRVRENRMHGSKRRDWKRALATARGSEHRRKTGGIGATAYGSYRASP